MVSHKLKTAINRISKQYVEKYSAPRRILIFLSVFGNVFERSLSCVMYYMKKCWKTSS